MNRFQAMLSVFQRIIVIVLCWLSPFIQIASADQSSGPTFNPGKVRKGADFGSIPPSGVSLHAGFENGVFIGKGLVQSSISIADIDEDGLKELMVGSPDGSIYGYNGDGSPVIPNQILNPGTLFTTPGKASIFSTPTTVDTDLDNRVELLFGTDGGVIYHLKLLLSSDVIDNGTKTLKSFPEPILLPAPKDTPARGEEDDTGS